MASMPPADRMASPPSILPIGVPIISMPARRAGSTPHDAQISSSHPVPLNSGADVNAVLMSTTDAPARAKLATAGAGQYPCGVGGSGGRPPQEADDLPGVGVGRSVDAFGAPSLVAVKQTGGVGPAATIDCGQ